MMLRAGRNAAAAFLVLTPVLTPVLTATAALAGDGSFGIPASGILMPPPPQARTAALIPVERNDIDRPRPAQRMQQTYTPPPAPAEGAGRSRVIPPSEAPIHSPLVVPPKKKRFGAPVATVDPSYVERIAAVDEPQQAASVPAPVPLSPPVMAQGAAGESKRGLFGMLRSRSASAAAYEEHTSMRPAPQMASAQMMPAQQNAARQGSAIAPRIARDGTPCAQLRGIFTSPAECR